MRKARFVIIPAIAVAAWAAFDSYRAREIAMSEMPTRTAEAVNLDTQESIILANLSISYSVLEDAINKAGLNLAGSRSDSAEIKCVEDKFFKIKECLTINWSVDYSLNGRITVIHEGVMIKVTVPAKFSGYAGFGGEIANILSLNRKNIDGSFAVTASAAMMLDERFCPVVVPGDISFSWEDEGKIEMIGHTEFRIFRFGFDVGPWDLDVGRHLNGQIRDAIRNGLASAGNAIPCDSVRAELTKAWKNYSVPVPVESGTPLFINVEPTSIGASGLIIDEAGVRMVGRLVAKALVTSSRGSEEPKGDLPLNEAPAAEPGRLQLAVPLKIPYRILEAKVMEALGNRDFVVATPGNDTKIVVQDVIVYPSGDKIALGVGLSADLPWRIFDAKGTVWVTAKPVVEQDGMMVRLDEVEISRQIDNPLWASASLLMRDTINAEIERIAYQDLQPMSDKAVEAVELAISNSDHTGGVQFSISGARIRLGRIVAEEQGLAVEGLLDAEWGASLEKIDLP